MDRTRRKVSPSPAKARSRFAEAAALHERGRIAEAERLLDEILLGEPDHHAALRLRGAIALQTGRTEEAVALIARSIALHPVDPFAHRNLGYALGLLGRREEAIASCEKAIALKPDFANAHFNRGALLEEIAQFDEAFASYENAIRADPGYAEAHNNRANALKRMNRHEEALAAATRAIALKRGYPEAHVTRGGALYGLKRYEEAARSFEKALAFRPDYWSAYAGLGIAKNALKRFDEAQASFRRAMELHSLCARGPKFEAEHAVLLGNLFHTCMRTCDWSDLDLLVTEIVNQTDTRCATHPFPMLAASHSPSLHRKVAEGWARTCVPEVKSNRLSPHPRGEKIRVGFFSADFHHHATAELIAELVERHDRARFEWTAFSFGPDYRDGMRARLQRAFDRFCEARAASDRDIANLARELQIDIAVDLKGYTEDSRPGIFALRAAPVQVNYLGYPGTIGAPYIDYLIADPFLIPETHREHYSEKIVTLPDTYQPNDTKRAIAERVPSRGELGLPEKGFVFCCFNASFKIQAETFASWMRILAKTGGGVLWLLDDNPSATANLKREAGSRGIDPARLIFAPRVPVPEHLARHKQADLFLDTFPYGAHTSASEALWAGLPVLTLVGDTFASRVAASLLHAVGMPELVTTTLGEYEALALALASSPENLGSVKRKLAENRPGAPLFDSERYGKHFEAALVAMAERHWANLPPEHIVIAPAD